MKKHWNVTIQHAMLNVEWALALLFIQSLAFAQRPASVGISVSPGFTFVNLESALGYPDSYLNDWSPLYLSVKAQGFLPSKGNFQFGADLGWNRLYYAYYIVPYGMGNLYYEFNTTTLQLMVSGRYSLSHFFVLGSGGIHIFSTGTVPALGGEVGWALTPGEHIAIPISLRVAAIFGDGTPIPVSIGTGILYNF